MKTLISTAALCLALSPAYAGPLSGLSCLIEGRTASAIMQNRQDLVVTEAVYIEAEIAFGAENPAVFEAQTQSAVRLIEAAYATPFALLHEDRHQVIEDFGVAAERACLERLQ